MHMLGWRARRAHEDGDRNTGVASACCAGGMPATATLCANDPRCLQRAEDLLAAGDTGAASKALGFHLAGVRPPQARWLNAAGLLMLLKGDLFSATSLLQSVKQQPFGPATHLAAAKNLYWASHLTRESAETKANLRT